MRIEFGAHGRRLIRAALMGTALLATASAFAQSPIDLTIDFARVMKLERPAATIVIGNPGIADATVEDETTVVLTGKAAGVTNFIVLDADCKEIMQSLVRVSSDVRQLTTVFYGKERQTFSCAPVCEQVISVGDAQPAFEKATTQIETRTQFATGR